MKLITSNKLNKFWKSGVLPIKNALTGKQDKSKVLNTKEAIMANTSSEYAAGALVVKELNNNLPQFLYDEEGKIVGYKSPGGADSVFPFSNNEPLEFEIASYPTSGTYYGIGQLIFNTNAFKKIKIVSHNVTESRLKGYTGKYASGTETHIATNMAVGKEWDISEYVSIIVQVMDANIQHKLRFVIY